MSSISVMITKWEGGGGGAKIVRKKQNHKTQKTGSKD